MRRCQVPVGVAFGEPVARAGSRQSRSGRTGEGCGAGAAEQAARAVSTRRQAVRVIREGPRAAVDRDSRRQPFDRRRPDAPAVRQPRPRPLEACRPWRPERVRAAPSAAAPPPAAPKCQPWTSRATRCQGGGRRHRRTPAAGAAPVQASDAAVAEAVPCDGPARPGAGPCPQAPDGRRSACLPRRS